MHVRRTLFWNRFVLVQLLLRGLPWGLKPKICLFMENLILYCLVDRSLSSGMPVCKSFLGSNRYWSELYSVWFFFRLVGPGVTSG